MEVKFMRRLTESHIDALYEAMEERMMERLEALENNKYNEEQHYIALVILPRLSNLTKDELSLAP